MVTPPIVINLHSFLVEVMLPDVQKLGQRHARDLCFQRGHKVPTRFMGPPQQSI
jgi:hypothetical protein